VAGDRIEDSIDFEIDGVRFVCGFVDRNRDNQFTLMKPASLLQRYEPLLVGFDRPRMMELGIAYGGSLAYFALRARPTKLVGIEYAPNRLGHLDRLIESRDLSSSVRPYYGVDQADRDRLREIASVEFQGQPLDLVVDDASHRYDPTPASFETLFPLMRPGSMYVIEDWVGLHEMAAAFQRMLDEAPTGEAEQLAARIAERIECGGGAETSLLRLAIELMLAQVSPIQLIDELIINRYWIAVRRGPAPLSAAKFRLTDHYTDPFGMVRP
jgi:Methyltransferase domain